MKNEDKLKKQRFFTTKNIATLAILTTISYILYMFVKINLPFFPGFLDLQISDVPILIGGYMLGPLGGLVILILKILLKLPASGTGGVGELADFFIGLAFLLPAALIYKKDKTKRGALIGLFLGMISSTAVAILANYLLLVPCYVTLFFRGEWNNLLNSVRALYPNITKENFYTIYLSAAVLPFNLLRGSISAIITFFLYKGLSRAYKDGFHMTTKIKDPTSSKDLKNNKSE